MNEQLRIDAEELADEIQRYLVVVDAFRRASCEPTWRPEWISPELAGRPDRKTARVERSAH
jgi:hypothetical protein